MDLYRRTDYRKYGCINCGSNNVNMDTKSKYLTIAKCNDCNIEFNIINKEIKNIPFSLEINNIKCIVLNHPRCNSVNNSKSML